MKSREKIKANRQLKKARQEMLDRRDYCGVRQPTPYDAVKHMIQDDLDEYAMSQRKKAQNRRIGVWTAQQSAFAN